MKAQFFDLAQRLGAAARAGELVLCAFSGERSDFVRFNRGAVRQAGSVEQRVLTLRLVHRRRQASATLTLAGAMEDFERAAAALARLRDSLPALPEDPWLLVNETPRSGASERRGGLAPAEAVAEQAVAAAREGTDGRGSLDLVGLYAGGTLYRGFANSLGQRNWHEVDSFNFDWSLYREGDQAVKEGYAGFHWDEAAFRAKLEAAAQRLECFAVPRRRLEPGEYRVFLAPRALEEVMGMLSWGGFSARARATKQSPLLKMEQGARLAAALSLAENTAEGIAPPFQGEGFIRAPRVPLIEAGRLGEALASPRTAREHGLQTNGASAGEAPESLDMAPGALAEEDVLGALDTGLYVSNLWYLNYSDRPAGRITGMTRFATLWVQDGRIAAPAEPMRFDDSLYRMLGTELAALTSGRELLLDPSTYGERSSASMRLPGALLERLAFTL